MLIGCYSPSSSQGGCKEGCKTYITQRTHDNTTHSDNTQHTTIAHVSLSLSSLLTVCQRGRATAHSSTQSHGWSHHIRSSLLNSFDLFVFRTRVFACNTHSTQLCFVCISNFQSSWLPDLSTVISTVLSTPLSPKCVLPPCDPCT